MTSPLALTGWFLVRKQSQESDLDPAIFPFSFFFFWSWAPDLRRYSSELSLVPRARVQLAVTGSSSFYAFVFTSRFQLPLFVVSGTQFLGSDSIAVGMFSDVNTVLAHCYTMYTRSHSYRVLLLNLLTLLSCIVTGGHLTTLICKWSCAYVSKSVCLFRFCSLGQRDSDQMMDCGVPIYWHWSEEVLVSASPEDGGLFGGWVRGWGWIGRSVIECSIEVSDNLVLCLCEYTDLCTSIVLLLNGQWQGIICISDYSVLRTILRTPGWHQQMKLAAVDRIIYNYHTHVF